MSNITEQDKEKARKVTYDLGLEERLSPNEYERTVTFFAQALANERDHVIDQLNRADARYYALLTKHESTLLLAAEVEKLRAGLREAAKLKSRWDDKGEFYKPSDVTPVLKNLRAILDSPSPAAAHFAAMREEVRNAALDEASDAAYTWVPNTPVFYNYNNETRNNASIAAKILALKT